MGHRWIAALLAPPRCAVCRRACGVEETACRLCRRRLGELQPLRGGGPQGVDSAWAAAPHQGVARDLVVAFKFRRLLVLAELMAERISHSAPPTLLSGVLVPIPTSPQRALLRGFDPAAELALALGTRCSIPVAPVLARSGPGRQVGRRRGQRLGEPPRIRLRGPAPASVVLVDDVLTTGATVTAAARALREGGCRRIVAVTFCRRP